MAEPKTKPKEEPKVPAVDELGLSPEFLADLPEPERLAAASALNAADSAEPNFEETWRAARDFYEPVSGILAESLGAAKGTFDSLLDITVQANRGPHGNEMRPDWVSVLGSQERGYVSGLRGAMQEIAKQIKATVEFIDARLGNAATPEQPQEDSESTD